MKNLLIETEGKIKESSHTPRGISFIGSVDGEYACTWDKFKEIADQEYDSGYSSVKVAKDLMIAFNDGSLLIRQSYDGSEWWRFIPQPRLVENPKPINHVISWTEGTTLAEYNDQ